MDYVLIGLGILFILLGIVGGLLPVLPGPPLSYVGLLFLHFTNKYQFSEKFLISWALITIVVYAVDYVVPIWGTKKFGGSKRGVWGCMIGVVAGLFFLPPFGIIICPFVGAVVGELTGGKEMNLALRAGFGSFIGFLAGTILKLIVSGIMAWHFFKLMI